MKENLILKARNFAFQKHDEIGHVRKYTGEPYTNHLEAVASIVATVKHTPEMVAAAYLHDTVEDTNTTFTEILNEFGDAVCSYVFYLTDASKGFPDKRAVRKMLDLRHLARAPFQVHTIKLADLIDNAQSIIKHDPKFAEVYMKEKRDLVNAMIGDYTLREKAFEILGDYYDEH